MKRIIYFDILNILACFAVLALHHNGIVHWFKVDTLAWKEALAFEVLFYWAVPVFFMLSGATLLDYREKYSTKEFFYKRVLRIFIPFVFWNVIILIHNWATNEFPYKTIQDVISAVIQTKLKYGDIYWFFIPLISLYCFIPVISLLNNNKKILWYIVCFIFITHSCLPLLFLLLGVKYNYTIAFPTAGYTLFIVLGYILSKTNLSQKQCYSIYILAIFSVLLRYLGTYNLSLSSGSLDRTLFGYVHFHSVFLASAVFIFIKNIFYTYKPNDKTRKIIQSLSSYSFGVCLIHILLIKYELRFLNITSDNIYWRFFGMFLTYIICIAIIYLIKKTPVIGKYIA